MDVSDDLCNRFLGWLGKDGIRFFSNVKKKYGTVSAVWNRYGIPHSVHFNEGMQVRNWMREQDIFKNKNAHWLDDNWVEFVERCIKNG